MKKLLLPLLLLGLVKLVKRFLFRGRSAGPRRGAARRAVTTRPATVAARAISPDEPFRDCRLGVPHFMQEVFASWCYAACAQMVIAAVEGTLLEQCEIVSFVKHPSCCADRTRSICVDNGAGHDDIAEIYLNFGVSAFRRFGIISREEVEDEILFARRPVEVTVEWKERPGSFHAVIISGYCDGLLAINNPALDPAIEQGPRWVTYKYLVNGLYHTWDDTWTGLERL